MKPSLVDCSPGLRVLAIHGPGGRQCGLYSNGSAVCRLMRLKARARTADQESSSTSRSGSAASNNAKCNELPETSGDLCSSTLQQQVHHSLPAQCRDQRGRCCPAVANDFTLSPLCYGKHQPLGWANSLQLASGGGSEASAVQSLVLVQKSEMDVSAVLSCKVVAFSCNAVQIFSTGLG